MIRFLVLITGCLMLVGANAQVPPSFGICAACHPFFTGEQRFVDTAGRVDKFAQRYGSTRARRATPKLSDAAAAAPSEEASA